MNNFSNKNTKETAEVNHCYCSFNTVEDRLCLNILAYSEAEKIAHTDCLYDREYDNSQYTQRRNT